MSWTQALKNYYSRYDNRDGYWVTNRQEVCMAWRCWIKMWFTSQADRVGPGIFHHTTQNGVQLKNYKLFTFGIFNLIFSNFGWSYWTSESETSDKGGATVYTRLSERAIKGKHNSVHESTAQKNNYNIQ